MNGIFEIAEASMIDGMERMKLISHNLANSNTTGYKRDIGVSNVFETHLMRLSPSDTVPRQQDALQNSRVTDMSSGFLKQTNRSLDLAIEGDAYFKVTGAGGDFYTRNGTFTLDSAGQVVNSSGMALATQAGELRISGDEFFIDTEGQVWENDRVIDQIKLVKLVNPEHMEKLGKNLFREQGPASVMELKDENVRLRQGYLETSNVVVMDEMVNMISTMRHFEINQHVIKGYDGMLDTAIQTLGEF